MPATEVSFYIYLILLAPLEVSYCYVNFVDKEMEGS